MDKKENLLRASDTYLNPYEQYYATHSGSSRFSEEAWEKFYRAGEANTFIGIQDGIDRLEQKEYDDLSKKLRFDLMDDETRFDALTNHIFADNTEVKDWTIETYDEYGQKQTETFTGTQREYNERAFENYANQLAEIENQKAREEAKQQWRKDHSFLAFLADAGDATVGTLYRTLSSALDMVWDTASIIPSVVSMFDTSYSDPFTAYMETAKRLDEINPLNELDEAVTQWRMDYTYAIDTFGNYNKFAMSLDSIAQSIGRMVPSIILTAVGVPSGISNFGYWSGSFQSEVIETANSVEFANTPAWELMLNQGLKTGAEYLVQLGLNKVIGSSVIDSAAFGYHNKVIDAAEKITFKSAVKRIVKDAVHEGLEEYFQQESGYLINTMFGYFDEEFNINNKFDFQTQMDALVLGFFGSLVGSVTLLGVNRLKGGYKGGLKNFLANYEFNQVYNEVNEQVNRIKKLSESGKLSITQYSKMVNSLLFSIQSMSDYMSTIGMERSQSAIDLMNKITQYANEKQYLVGNRSLYEQRDVSDIVNTATSALEKIGLYEVMYYKGLQAEYKQNKKDNRQKVKENRQKAKEDFKNKLSNVLKKRNVTKIDKVVTKEQLDTSVDEIDQATKEIMDEIDAKAAIITKDGNGSEKVNDDVVVIPKKQVENRPKTEIEKGIAQRDIVERVQLSKRFSRVKDKLEGIYKKFNTLNTYDVLTSVEQEQMVLSLLFNQDFQKVCLAEGSKEMYELVSVLDEFMSDETITKKHGKDSVYDQIMVDQIDKSISGLKRILSDFLANQQFASYESLTIFTDEEKRKISSKRYGKDFSNRIIFKGNITEKEYKVLENKVNSLPIADRLKKEILDGFKSDNILKRYASFKSLDQFYKNVFFSSYNGDKYMQLTTTANQILNIYLEQNNISAKAIKEMLSGSSMYTGSDYVKKLFIYPGQENLAERIINDIQRYNKNLNVFVDWYVDERGVRKSRLVCTVKTVKSDYNDFKDEEMLSGHNNPFVEVITNNAKEVMDSIVDDNIALYNINDVVFDPTIKLSKGVQAVLDERYEGKSDVWENRLYAIRYYLIGKYNQSISFMRDGTLAITDLKRSFDVLKNKGIKLSDIKNGDKLSKHINSNFLTSLGRNTTIKFLEEGNTSWFSEEENTIYLEKVQDPRFFRAYFVHEVQHVLQAQYSLNGGMDNNLFDNYENDEQTKAVIKKIYRDIKQIAPELVKDTPETIEGMKTVVSRLTYYATGENSAYGQVDRIFEFIPFITQKTDKGTVITSPLGNQYLVPYYSNRQKVKSIIHTTPNDFTKIITNDERFSDYFKLENLNNSLNERSLFSEKFSEWSSIINNPLIQGFQSTGLITGDFKSSLYYKEFLNNYLSPDLITAFQYYFAACKGVPISKINDLYNVDIPFIRFQSNKHNISNIPFNSVIPGTSQSTTELIIRRATAVSKENLKTYVQIGSFKLKDLLVCFNNYDKTSEEALISSNAFNSNVDVYSILFKNVSESDDDFSTKTQMTLTRIGTLKSYDEQFDVNHANNQYSKTTYIENYSADLTEEYKKYNYENFRIPYYANLSDFEEAVYEEALFNTDTYNFKQYLEYINHIYVNINGNVLTELSGMYGFKSPAPLSSNFIFINVNNGNKNWKVYLNGILTKNQLVELNKILNQVEYEGDITVIDKSTVYNFKFGDNFIEQIKGTFSFNPNDVFKQKSKKLTDVKEVKVIDNEELQKKKEAEQKAKYNERRRLGYVANKDAYGSNLEYYIEKGRPIFMDPDVQDFVKDIDPVRVDPALWDLIGGKHKGKLRSKNDIIKYVKNNLISTKEDRMMQDYTLEMICKYIFHSKITSFDQVVELVNQAENIYALQSILWDKEKHQSIQMSIPPEIVGKFAAKIAEGKQNYAAFSKAMEYYEQYRGHVVDIHEDDLMLAFMQHYDGTLQSLMYAVNIAKWKAVHNFQLTNTSGSIDAEGKDRHGETYINEREDVHAQDTFQNIIDGYSNSQLVQMVYDLYFESQARKYAKKGLSYTQVLNRLSKFKQKLSELSTDELASLLWRGQSNELDAKSPEIAISDDKEKQEIPFVYGSRTNLRTRIKSNATRATNYLSRKPADIKRFLDENGDIFNEDLTLKRETYEGKSQSEMNELLDRILKIKQKAHANAYQSKARMNAWDVTQKKIEREKKKSAKKDAIYDNGIVKQVTREYELGKEHEKIQIDSTIEMPEIVRKIMDTSMSYYDRTRIEVLAENYDDIHVRTSVKEFLADNFETLATLSEDDVRVIVDFFENMTVHGTFEGNDTARMFEAFSVYTLAYISGFMEHTLNVSQDLVVRADNILEQKVGTAGTVLASWRNVTHKTWKNVVKEAKSVESEAEVFKQQAKRIADIEVSTTLAAELISAVRRHDIPAVELAMSKIKGNLETQYKHNKRSFLDKCVKLQRAAMLSSPGTMIRNAVSNMIVTGLNKTADAIGNTFFGGMKRFSRFKDGDFQSGILKGQYVLTGTQVPDHILKFIQQNFVDNGLFKNIQDGMSKYDIRKPKSRTESAIADMIIEHIKSEVFAENQFNTDGKVGQLTNDVVNLVFKGLSDDRWVNKKALSIFGKMLAEDEMKTNKRLEEPNAKTYEKLAEAYTLAAYLYMRRPNFANSIESTIRVKLGPKAYFVYKQIFPFAVSSINWAIEAFNYTPFGLVKAIKDMCTLEKIAANLDDKRKKGEHVVSSKFTEYLVKQRLGKGIIGSVLFTLGIALGATGIIRLGKDDDEKLVLKVGDLEVDISSIFSSSSLLAGAALTSFKYEDDLTFWDALMISGNTIFEEWIFTDVFNSLRYQNSITEWITKQPVEVLSKFVPNVVKQFNKIIQPYERDYNSGILGALERFTTDAIPGLSYAFPTVIDPFTGEAKMKYKMSPLWDIIALSGVKFRPYDVSYAEKEALTYGLRKGNLTGKYEDLDELGISLSKSDIEALNKIYGILNKNSLDELFENKKKYRVQMPDGKYKELTYSKMSDEQKKSVINRIMTDNASKAKIYIYTKKGIKYYTNKEERKELNKLGIDNVYIETDKKKGFVQ